jgi:carboxyl-terminal processing protease
MINKFLARARRSLSAMALLLAVALASAEIVKAQNPSGRSTPATRSLSDSLSAEDRTEVFEEVWRTINEKYYDPNFNGVDWTAMRERYRPRAAAATSDAEFYTVLNQMTGELRDAHTRVRSPRGREERRRRQGTSTGVRIYEVEGVPVIFDVSPDSDAARAGVQPGMIVRTINGQPVEEALAEARRAVGTSSSERATRLLSYSRLIAGEPNTQLRLGLTRADGTQFEVTLTRRVISTAPQFAARLLPSGYAYIRFDRFRSPVSRQVRDALTRFRDAPGLILDLRSNGGGDGEEGLRIGGHFFNERVPIARLVTRTGRPPSALFGLISLPREFQAGRRGGQIYSNPVIILTNEATGSTSELFASAMQEHGRAQVIGTQSCGCVLGVINHRELRGGGELSVSEIGFITARGRTLEGNGVIPDHSITLTLEDLRRGRDAALEEAERRLSSMRNAPLSR